MGKPGSIGNGGVAGTGRRTRSRAKRGAGLPPVQAGEAGLPCLQVITSYPDGNPTGPETTEEPFQLSGSARRSAFALAENAISAVKAWGLDRTLFVTLTFGGGRKGPSIKKAQGAFHRFEKHALSRRYAGGLKVLERGEKNGRVHFHLLLDAGADVRSGADFAAIDAKDTRSLNAVCRAEYSWLRINAPRYGFGRIVNSLPIKSTEEGVARYVSKYITKHMIQRFPADKGARLCSYWGTGRKNRVCVSLKFSWAGIGGWLFRAKLAGLSKLNGIKDQEAWAEKFGPRWAYQIQKFVKAFPLSRWSTAYHALADGVDFDSSGEDLSNIAELRIKRKTEMRWTMLHGKAFAWICLTVVEPGWVERGRKLETAKKTSSTTVEKVEWVDVTEMRGDAVVFKRRARYSTP